MTARLDRIVREAAERPYEALVAAMLAVAVAEARDGDAEAHEWLAGPQCRPWLWLLTPDKAGASADALQVQLVARASRGPSIRRKGA